MWASAPRPLVSRGTIAAGLPSSTNAQLRERDLKEGLRHRGAAALTCAAGRHLVAHSLGV